MHPLRFPNSGIRAKVFVRKIGFKLRVMRLNRVELFYALVAVIGSESRHCLRGRGSRPLATSSQGPADSNQPARGCRPRPALLPTGAAASVAGLAAPWQGGCQPQRVIAACAGAMATQ
ncbi:hypothetical protein BHE74_00028771 [Ensete ventricosum]|nr:hypothetical protein BHE74_00028771 [Ensete ventricosum]